MIVIKNNLKKPLIFVVIILAILGLYYFFLFGYTELFVPPTKKTKPSEIETKEKIIKSKVARFSENYLNKTIKKRENITLGELYFPYKVLRIIHKNSSTTFGERILKYISGMMYEDGIISYTAKGLNNPFKATFMTSELDDEIKYDLGKIINESVLLKRRIGRNFPEKGFYLTDSLKLMNLINKPFPEKDKKNYKSYYLSEFCEYSPSFYHPSDPTYIKNEYYRTRILRLLTGKKKASEIEFKYTTNKSTSPCYTEENMRNQTKLMECIRSLNTTQTQSNQVEVKCLPDKDIKFTKAVIERFWELKENKTLEEIFWVYRLRDFYNMKYNKTKMKAKVIEFFDPEIRSFTIKKDGIKPSPEANFYAICLLENCRGAEEW